MEDLMLGLILLFSPFFLLLGYQTFQVSKWGKIGKVARDQKEAVFLDCDMSSKLRQLIDDPTMTDAKWRQWLPVFEEADAIVRSKTTLPLGHNADLVRRIISETD
jgi:hypothetical protein